MCYSAMAKQSYRKFLRDFGARVDMQEYVKRFWDWNEGSPYKVPKAMLDAFSDPQTPEEAEAWALIQQRRQADALAIQELLFTQKQRLVAAERKLATKETKAALNDQRIATNKIDKAKRDLEDLNRTEPKERDTRFFPGWYCTVLTEENGERIVRPMRYHCRPEGTPAFFDAKYPGTYNARRDSLGGYWKKLFGYKHGLIVATRFFENVEGTDGKNQVLEFKPKTGEDMLIACLWSHWTDPKGVEADLYSFAAITDDPEPEVAAAGHDRTIINIKPEHVDAWLNPQGDLAAMQAIFDDKRHPFYEHRLAA